MEQGAIGNRGRVSRSSSLRRSSSANVSSSNVPTANVSTANVPTANVTSSPRPSTSKVSTMVKDEEEEPFPDDGQESSIGIGNPSSNNGPCMYTFEMLEEHITKGKHGKKLYKVRLILPLILS